MNTVDLHPSKVSSMEMGYIFEELIRKFAEASNETAGEHFTPREVIRLMVNLLFVHDSDALTKKGIVKTMYDPACGTGGMLSIAEEYLHELNPNAQLELFGQELNPESYAICKSDMLIKGQNANHIKLGNSFTQDQLENERFDYMLSNPPFGVEWKKVEKEIKKEHAEKVDHYTRRARVRWVAQRCRRAPDQSLHLQDAYSGENLRDSHLGVEDDVVDARRVALDGFQYGGLRLFLAGRAEAVAAARPSGVGGHRDGDAGGARCRTGLPRRDRRESGRC